MNRQLTTFTGAACWSPYCATSTTPSAPNERNVLFATDVRTAPTVADASTPCDRTTVTPEAGARASTRLRSKTQFR